MANYSVIDAGGLIVNRIVANNLGDWTPAGGYSLIAEPAGGYAIGGTYIGGTYTPPAQPTPPPPTAEEVAEATRQKTFKDDTSRAAMLGRLRSATNSQIDTYVAANVTTLAEARSAIGVILKLIALDSRQ